MPELKVKLKEEHVALLEKLNANMEAIKKLQEENNTLLKEFTKDSVESGN